MDVAATSWKEDRSFTWRLQYPIYNTARQPICTTQRTILTPFVFLTQVHKSRKTISIITKHACALSYMFGSRNSRLSPNRKLWHEQNRRGVCLRLSSEGDREEERPRLLGSKTRLSAHKRKENLAFWMKERKIYACVGIKFTCFCLQRNCRIHEYECKWCHWRLAHESIPRHLLGLMTEMIYRSQIHRFQDLWLSFCLHPVLWSGLKFFSTIIVRVN
jgi:hypothetical protein